MANEHVEAMRGTGRRLSDALIPRSAPVPSYQESRIGAIGELNLPDGGKVVVGAYGFLGLALPGSGGRPVLYDFGEGSKVCQDAFLREYARPFREAGWPVVAVWEQRVKDRMWDEHRVPCLVHGEVAEHVLRSSGALAAVEDYLEGRLMAEAGLVAWGERPTAMARSGRIVVPAPVPQVAAVAL